MNYKWTVLFLVHASNKQTRAHVKALIDMLKGTHYNKEIKVLVLYGALQHSTSHGVRIQVTLHEIIQHDSDGRLLFNEILPGYGVIDMGDDQKLRSIFSEIRIDYPSDRFLMFTWDHGSGFGIFKTNPKERGLGTTPIFLNFEMELMKEGGTRSFALSKENIDFDIITNYSEENSTNSYDLAEARGAEKKKIDTSMLTNDELRNILTYKAQGKKVDLLIMMNCAMQMIETGYALNDAVEYLVAPETCIFWAGYDYKSIINLLCTNPQVETETLGKFALDTIEAYYQNTPSKDYYDDLVVSLVKPGRSILLKEVIDELGAQVGEHLAESFESVKNIRQDCEDLTQKYVGRIPYHYIDFPDCMASLKQVFDKIDLKKLKQAVDAYVIHIIKGSNYQGTNEKNDMSRANGFTIYYPPSAHFADNDYYYKWFYNAGHQQTLFARDCHWKQFLQDYFRYDRSYQKKNTP